ncbi:MAG: NifU family protein [Phycisphaerales bacterium]|nr:NifU family protein [Phycisphaerales bacterium]
MNGLPTSAPANDVIERARDAIESYRPFIRPDGCDLEFLGVKDGMARIRILGLESGCCLQAEVTLQRMVERHLRAAVPEIRGVVSICE